MKRATILTLLAFAAACDDPTFPPEACGALDDTEVFIGEQELVVLCFRDPDGDAITATATASDPSVVEAVVQGGSQGILLTGKDAGKAVITVVAQDSEGASAPPQTFEVTVPNRAPEVAALPEIVLTDDTPGASLTLTEYFTDPDGHPLTFSAAVSDEAVIRADVTDNTLQIERVGHGNAIVRVTATDPHGLSVSADADVRLLVTVELLNDEFETLSDRWEGSQATVAEIVDGRLKLATNDPHLVGIVSHTVDKSKDWTVTTSTEYVTDDMWPALMVLTGGDPDIIAVLFGANLQRLVTEASGLPKTNLLVAVRVEGGWASHPSWSGWFDEITGKDTPMNVGASFDGESLKVLVDDAVILGFSLPEDLSAPATIAGIAASAWAPVDVESLDGSEQVYFDWIRVTGIPAGASRAGASPVALSLVPPPSSVRIIR